MTAFLARVATPTGLTAFPVVRCWHQKEDRPHRWLEDLLICDSCGAVSIT